MLITSRSKHRLQAASCKAKWAAEEGQKLTGFFAPARGSSSASPSPCEPAQTAVEPPTAPSSKGAGLGKEGALNSDLGSVSGVMESMVRYFDVKFAEIHKKLELQDSQMEQIEYKLGSELKQIKQQLGKQQEKQQDL